MKFGFRITATKSGGTPFGSSLNVSRLKNVFARCTKKLLSEKITEREKVLKFNVFYR